MKYSFPFFTVAFQERERKQEKKKVIVMSMYACMDVYQITEITIYSNKDNCSWKNFYIIKRKKISEKFIAFQGIKGLDTQSMYSLAYLKVFGLYFLLT